MSGTGPVAGAGAAAAPLAAVVVPAHDEAAVIGRCLDALAGPAADGLVEVVVACNGCADNTAEIARGRPGVRVLDLAEASKPAALRAGEAAVTAFPRVYLDADVVLPADALLAVIKVLADDTVPAARPPIAYDTAGAAAAVRRYYRARRNVPAVMNSLWGAGVYALSRSGRARFGAFPDVVGDDLWVDGLFAPGEVRVVDCAPVVVTTPRTTRGLVAVLRRANRGKAEHHRAGPGARGTAGGVSRDLLRLARTGPGAAADAVVYAGLSLWARVLVRAGARWRWERDETSRAG